MSVTGIVTWNTTKESIERERKYHQAEKEFDVLELCQQIC